MRVSVCDLCVCTLSFAEIAKRCSCCAAAKREREREAGKTSNLGCARVWRGRGEIARAYTVLAVGFVPANAGGSLLVLCLEGLSGKL